MATPLRKLFPSVAVGPVGVAAALGIDWVPGAKLPCPSKKCTTSNDRLTIPTTRDPEGGWWAGPCPGCGWVGSVFELYLTKTEQESTAAIRTLRRAGYRVPRGCSSPKVLAEWEKYRSTRVALKTLHDHMNARRLYGPVHGHALASMGLTNHPHNPPYWWCTTPGELAAWTGKTLTPSSAVYRRAGAVTPEHAATPTVAVPLYDRLGRLTGVVGLPPYDDDAGAQYTRTRSGTVALGFYHAATATAPPLGDAGLLSTSLHLSTTLVSSYLRDNPTPPPVVYLADASRPAAVAAALRGRPWVYLADAFRDFHGSQGAVVATLSRLGARVLRLHERVKTVADVGRLMHRECPTWENYYEYLVFNLKTDDALRSFVADAGGWDAATAKHLRGVWGGVLWDRVNRTMASTTKLHRVTLDAGFTVVETGNTWVWDETGEVLARAYPAAVKVERVHGKIWYRGLVVYANHCLPFLSTRFRRDPVGVITAVLLRAGINDPPAVHPRLVPHLAAVAAYFSEVSNV